MEKKLGLNLFWPVRVGNRNGIPIAKHGNRYTIHFPGVGVEHGYEEPVVQRVLLLPRNTLKK